MQFKQSELESQLSRNLSNLEGDGAGTLRRTWTVLSLQLALRLTVEMGMRTWTDNEYHSRRQGLVRCLRRFVCTLEEASHSCCAIVKDTNPHGHTTTRKMTIPPTMSLGYSGREIYSGYFWEMCFAVPTTIHTGCAGRRLIIPILISRVWPDIV